MLATIFALFQSPTRAEEAITSLIETAVPESDISLVMDDIAKAADIIAPGGPLKHVSLATLPATLLTVGLDEQVVTQYRTGVAIGKCLVAVSIPEDRVSAVKEIFTDTSAQHITVLLGAAKQ